MITAVIVAAICNMALAAALVASLRSAATERSHLIADMRVVHRQAFRAVMAKNGVEFDIAEARGALLENLGNDRPEPDARQRHDPPLEGLG